MAATGVNRRLLARRFWLLSIAGVAQEVAGEAVAISMSGAGHGCVITIRDSLVEQDDGTVVLAGKPVDRCAVSRLYHADRRVVSDALIEEI
jgi:hypothetical protein